MHLNFYEIVVFFTNLRLNNEKLIKVKENCIYFCQRKMIKSIMFPYYCLLVVTVVLLILPSLQTKIEQSCQLALTLRAYFLYR